MWIKFGSLEVTESVLIKVSKVPCQFVLKQLRYNVPILKYNFNWHYHVYLQTVQYLNYADLHFYINLCIKFNKLHCMLRYWYVLSKLNWRILWWNLQHKENWCISRILNGNGNCFGHSCEKVLAIHLQS
jgi:hypothetical protein